MPSSAAAAADGGDIEEVDRLKKRIRTLEMEETKLNQHMERVIRGIEANEAYLVGMVLRIMEKGPEDETAEDDCDVGFHLQRKIIFRPIAGVVYPSKLKPGDLIGVDSTSNEHYCGIGGLEKQIEELVEAVVLPIIHKNCFQRLGIHPPKGVLLYGPPGTGKTLVAHAFASQTNATFLKLTGPQLAVIIFRPIAGVVYPSKLKPGDLIGVDSTSNEHYCGIGGLEKQIEELVEAVVLPIIHKNCFQRLGIHPPKGVLLYGPPGTGKTLVAHAFASQTNATFLKLTGPQLAVKLIGEGARLVRDAFQLAKEKAPCIIFIDEIDAIGSNHFDSGDREVQQTIVELLNQLDGVGSYESIKVIAATNRPEVLDPAFLRSGRLDQKIEFPHPSEQARVRILEIHSRKMDKNPDVNFEELACCTDDFNGAQLKAVCFEASMLAFHRDATEVRHEDFVRAIAQVKDGNY
ncbi:hypothetical protein OsI_15211 [Oryza sativa Indica Group]|uniref:AAA+ ATPase domain-containing protein n=1 Tax=Oryza sativa subsp. indica TaxID=39946 RepID=B8ARW9_ORYSI|nr:hypothetical protein OsI_15211 [Oryza sativa Indica Group]